MRSQQIAQTSTPSEAKGAFRQWLLNYWPGIVLSAILFGLLSYIWRFSYFWLDDFINLSVYGESGWRMLWDVVNPVSDAFRPFGAWIYWLAFQFFHLQALPYHQIAWTLHCINVFLLYCLLFRITGSRLGAATGAFLFGIRSNFADIYWSFGTIFEILACNLMFCCLLIHNTKSRSYPKIAAVCCLYILAIKSKEVAITLPVVLLGLDLSQDREFDRKALFQYLPLAAICLWFTCLKVSTMAGSTEGDPYFMDLRPSAFVHGYAWYFDSLYRMTLGWGTWMSLLAVLLIWMLHKKERHGLFFLGYMLITLLPVIFLVNHRNESYWYVPFLGFAGVLSIGIEALVRQIKKWSFVREPAISLLLFVALAFLHCQHDAKTLRYIVPWQRAVSVEYARFVNGLRRLPAPSAGETVCYRSFPRYFSEQTLGLATAIVLQRDDLKVKIDPRTSKVCGYSLEYENGALKLVQ